MLNRRFRLGNLEKYGPLCALWESGGIDTDRIGHSEYSNCKMFINIRIFMLGSRMMSPERLSPLKVGVIGLGRFGRLHALTLAGLAEAELVALVARRQHSLDALARDLPGVRGWTSLSQALDESDAEAWVIACSTPSYVPVARAVLERGKVVLLEKPIADDLSEARSLAPLVRSDAANIMMGHIVLFSSEFREICSVAYAH